MAKKILLISGHGAGDPGATAKIGKKTYKEADETIIMVNKIKEQLSGYDVAVELYPTERNAYEDAKAGTLKKDLGSYDYVLEIHFNACVNDLKGNGKVTGAEAYVTTYDSAQATEKEMLSCLKKIGFTNRGVKSHNYTVINRAKTKGADSCLLEVCFIDDADDMKIYLNSKDAVAKAIANGIVKGQGLKKTTSKETKKKTKKKSDVVEHTAKDAAQENDKALAGAYTTTVNLNMRHGAGKGKELMITLPKGTKVQCYGNYSNAAGSKWLYVVATLNEIKYTGFCAKQYLSKN